jgi:hypothetical protein
MKGCDVMGKERIYEMAPNKEVISNGSHTMFFPAQVQVSNSFKVNYKIDSKDDYYRDFLHSIGPDLIEPNMEDTYSNNKDIHKILDYTCISEESVINMLMLFSSTPKDSRDNVNSILTLMRRVGIDSFYSI